LTQALAPWQRTFRPGYLDDERAVTLQPDDIYLWLNPERYSFRDYDDSTVRSGREVIEGSSSLLFRRHNMGLDSCQPQTPCRILVGYATKLHCSAP
jgi:hypothetical protein